MPETTVNVSTSEREKENGDTRKVEQYQTTFPKALAEAFELENGDKIEWKIKSGNSAKVIILKDGD